MPDSMLVQRRFALASTVAAAIVAAIAALALAGWLLYSGWLPSYGSSSSTAQPPARRTQNQPSPGGVDPCAVVPHDGSGAAVLTSRELLQAPSFHYALLETYMRSFAHHRAPTSSACLLSLAAALTLAACSEQSTEPESQLTPQPSVVAAATTGPAGAVYTTTNGSASNAVIAFHRAPDGSLTPLGNFPSGGQGIGGAVDPLASQYAVVLSDDHRLLFTVNAGSNDVTSFRVAEDGALTRVSRRSSGGELPVSIAARDGRLYVLNAGDNTVTGLEVATDGSLTAIPNGTRHLAAGADGASTIHFSGDGSRVIVTERLANRIETLAVSASGRPGVPVVTRSRGAVPFGFDVSPDGIAVISEAGGTPSSAPNATVSSYRVRANGRAGVVTGGVGAGGRAACWVAITAFGRVAFIANSASNEIASVRVNGDGTLTLLDAAAARSPAGAIPIDIDISTGDRYLYTLEGGAGTVRGFAIGGNGRLTAGAAVPTGQGGASGLQGLAAF